MFEFGGGRVAILLEVLHTDIELFPLDYMDIQK